MNRRGQKTVLTSALAALALLAGLWATGSLAGSGDPDTSFANKGIALLGADTRLIGAAAQPDGKLVATGVEGQGARAAKLIVARFTTSGALDRSFSGNGIFEGPASSVGNAVALQANGKIVVAGAVTDGSGALPAGMLVLRLNANGSADRSFAGDGSAVALTATGQRGQALGVTLAGSKIVAAGSARVADGLDRTAVARFNANGTPDGSFGNGGAAIVDFGRNSLAHDVAVQKNGRIVLAGSRRQDTQTTTVLVARLTPSGAPDTSFAGSGAFVQQYAIGAGYSAVFGLALVGEKVVVGGAASVQATGHDAIAVRLTGAGKPDKTFSGDGVAYLPATTSRDQYEQTEPLPGATGLAVSGSDILLGGYFDNFSVKSLALWALRSNGALDKSFGDGGRSLTPVASSDLGGFLNDLVLSGGRLLGVGQTSSFFGATKGLAVAFQGLPVPLKTSVKANSSYPLGASLRRGIPVTVTCNQACTIAALLKAKGSTVANGGGKLRAAGSKRVTLHFTRAGKRKLAGENQVAAQLLVTAKGGGKTKKTSKGIVLRG